jgi:hypothetical protein
MTMVQHLLTDRSGTVDMTEVHQVPPDGSGTALFNTKVVTGPMGLCFSLLPGGSTVISTEDPVRWL